jgi:hypothetical protein
LQLLALEAADRGHQKREIVWKWGTYVGEVAILLFAPVAFVFCALNAWGVISWRAALRWYPFAWMTAKQKALYHRRGGHRLYLEPGLKLMTATSFLVFITVGIWLDIRSHLDGANQLILDVSIFHFLILFACNCFCPVSALLVREGQVLMSYSSPFTCSSTGAPQAKIF